MAERLTNKLLKTLIIAEKPSVARDLARVLAPGAVRGPNCLEADREIFAWALGHLLTLADADAYDNRYHTWRLDDLPIIPGTMRYRPLDKTQGHLRALAALIRRPDVGQIVNACDAGREGELIFREIMDFAGARKPVRRLWLSETTPESVRQAYADMAPQEAYDRLAQSAYLRQEADWLVGINASRVFSLRHRQRLSVGRVQTPTLALLVRREQEIEAFTPQAFYQIAASFITHTGETYQGLWVELGENGAVARDRLETYAEAQTHVHPTPRSGRVQDISDKEERVLPPPFPNLSDLQREANRQLGLTAAKTLSFLQSLYEKGHISYPRTDSRHLTENLSSSIPSRLKALQKVAPWEGLAEQAAGQIGQWKRYGKRYVDNTKVSDHHAIIVTAKTPGAQVLAGAEGKVYQLVARHFLAAFFPPARFAVRVVITEDEPAHDLFRSSSRQETEKGFHAVMPPTAHAKTSGNPEDGGEPALPPLLPGDPVELAAYDIREGTTQAPPRYTEAALLGAMESAGKKIDDKNLKEAMGTAGLGTPATRAAVIERLLTVGYAERQKKTLVPTAKGRSLVALVPDLLTQAELTARWEEGLQAVEEGGESGPKFREAITAFTKEIVELGRLSPARDFGQNAQSAESIGVCPLCRSSLVFFGKGYRCSKHNAPACSFVLWATVAGKKLTSKQLETLLAGKKTGVLKGFKSKAGKSFQAALVLEEGAVRFDFHAPAPKRRRSPAPSKTKSKRAATKKAVP